MNLAGLLWFVRQIHTHASATRNKAVFHNIFFLLINFLILNKFHIRFHRDMFYKKYDIFYRFYSRNKIMFRIQEHIDYFLYSKFH